MIKLMKLIRYAHEPLRSLLVFSLKTLTVAARRALAQVLTVSNARRPHGKAIAAAAMVLGLIMQLLAIWLLHEMILLCISLMEVWAELAAKHLEITLDRTG